MDAEQYYQCVLRELPANHATLEGWRQAKALGWCGRTGSRCVLPGEPSGDPGEEWQLLREELDAAFLEVGWDARLA